MNDYNKYSKLMIYKNLDEYFDFISTVDDAFKNTGPHFRILYPIKKIDFLKECRKILNEPALPWKEISERANQYFASEHDCRQWLIEILTTVDNVNTLTGFWFINAIPKNIRKEFRKGYPRLSELFNRKFKLMEISFHNHSDEEIIEIYTKESSYKVIDSLIAEIDKLLNCSDFPWTSINEEVLSYFPKPEYFKEWLMKMANIMRENRGQHPIK